MALNRIVSGTRQRQLPAVVPTGTKAGDAVLVDNGVPAVALTDRGDATRTYTYGGTTITEPSGGVGNAPTEAVVAYDGIYAFDIAGADGDEADGTLVYIEADGDLSLSDKDGAVNNTLYGRVKRPEGYHDIDGNLPVRVGG